MLKKLLVLMTVMTMLCFVMAASAQESELTPAEITITLPANYHDLSSSGIPTVSIEKTKKAYILTTDYVPPYEENTITVLDSSRFENAEPGSYDGRLIFRLIKGQWTTEKYHIMDSAGKKHDQKDLNFDASAIVGIQIASSTTDTKKGLVYSSKIEAIREEVMDSYFTIIQDNTISTMGEMMTIAENKLSAIYIWETGELNSSSITEVTNGAGISYHFDAFGVLNRISIKPEGEFRYKTYQKEGDVFISFMDGTMLDEESGVDLNKQAPVAIAYRVAVPVTDVRTLLPDGKDLEPTPMTAELKDSVVYVTVADQMIPVSVADLVIAHTNIQESEKTENADGTVTHQFPVDSTLELDQIQIRTHGRDGSQTSYKGNNLNYIEKGNFTWFAADGHYEFYGYDNPQYKYNASYLADGSLYEYMYMNADESEYIRYSIDGSILRYRINDYQGIAYTYTIEDGWTIKKDGETVAVDAPEGLNPEERMPNLLK